MAHDSLRSCLDGLVGIQSHLNGSSLLAWLDLQPRFNVMWPRHLHRALGKTDGDEEGNRQPRAAQPWEPPSHAPRRRGHAAATPALLPPLSPEGEERGA
eukprot:336837-Pyramimonas_sp.AAC.1